MITVSFLIVNVVYDSHLSVNFSALHLISLVAYNLRLRVITCKLLCNFWKHMAFVFLLLLLLFKFVIITQLVGADCCSGFYRGIGPGVTGSLATGATYFGFIESTKKWIEESHPNLGGHWAHFIAGGIGKPCTSFAIVYMLVDI